MGDNPYGRHSMMDAAKKQSPIPFQKPFYNNLTRRNIDLTENMPARKLSSTIASANIKALRLFRHICRLLPFIIRVHEIQHRVNPVQAKRYVANYFRKESKETDTERIDSLVQYGYETVYEAEMHYSNTGYLYKFIMPPQHNMRDHGINHINDQKAGRINEKPDSKFLESFYRGNKSHEV